MTPPLKPHRPPTREPDQHDQHREVEEQVAGLAQVAALGGDRAVVPVEPGSARPRSAACARSRTTVGLLVGLERGVLGQPGQVAGRLRRPGSYAAPVDAQPRDDAADQRDHQQDVDRGEPRRVVDAEQAELVVDRRQRGVRRLPLRGRARSRPPPAGSPSPGSARERQQEQQDQRGAHRGQLAPGPAEPARPGSAPERRRRAVAARPPGGARGWRGRSRCWCDRSHLRPPPSNRGRTTWTQPVDQLVPPAGDEQQPDGDQHHARRAR